MANPQNGSPKPKAPETKRPAPSVPETEAAPTVSKAVSAEPAPAPVEAQTPVVVAAPSTAARDLRTAKARRKRGRRIRPCPLAAEVHRSLGGKRHSVPRLRRAARQRQDDRRGDDSSVAFRERTARRAAAAVDRIDDARATSAELFHRADLRRARGVTRKLS